MADKAAKKQRYARTEVHADNRIETESQSVGATDKISHEKLALDALHVYRSNIGESSMSRQSDAVERADTLNSYSEIHEYAWNVYSKKLAEESRAFAQSESAKTTIANLQQVDFDPFPSRSLPERGGQRVTIEKRRIGGENSFTGITSLYNNSVQANLRHNTIERELIQYLDNLRQIREEIVAVLKSSNELRAKVQNELKLNLELSEQNRILQQQHNALLNMDPREQGLTINRKMNESK